MKHFTFEEATQALETVRPLAERLVEERRALLRLQEELQPLRGAIAGNGGGLDAARVEALQAAVDEAGRSIAACLEGIRSAGALVKDLDLGLVDFPAVRADGTTVLLCWRAGEAEILYWHGLDEGFAGRKPLPL